MHGTPSYNAVGPAPTIKVQELHGKPRRRGLRHSLYYFVLDDDRVVHISKYAKLVGKKDNYSYEYEVDLERIKGKKIVMIRASNRSIFCWAETLSAEELVHSEGAAAGNSESLSILNGREFDYLTSDEKKFLENDWRRYYLRMAKEIKRLEGSLGVPITLSDSLRCQLESGADYPLSYLIPYSSKSRKMSLENLGKEMHQVWAALEILDGLRRSGFDVTEANMSFEQGPDRPLFTVASGGHAYSFWYEFDAHPREMCGGRLIHLYASILGAPELRLLTLLREDVGARLSAMLEQEMKARQPALYSFYERAARHIVGGGPARTPPEAAGSPRGELEHPLLAILGSGSARRPRVPLRPDMIVFEDAKSCDDIYERGLEAKLIVELKDRDYEEWEGDVESQIIPYKEIFRPERMVVASVKPVPEGAKARLRSKGIEVVEGVYPGGPGEGALVDAVKEALLK